MGGQINDSISLVINTQKESPPFLLLRCTKDKAAVFQHVSRVTIMALIESSPHEKEQCVSTERGGRSMDVVGGLLFQTRQRFKTAVRSQLSYTRVSCLMDRHRSVLNDLGELVIYSPP